MNLYKTLNRVPQKAIAVACLGVGISLLLGAAGYGWLSYWRSYASVAIPEQVSVQKPAAKQDQAKKTLPEAKSAEKKTAEDLDIEVQGTKLSLYELSRVVEQGEDLEAIYALATVYRDGSHGVRVDPVRARELYFAAAEKGHAPSQYEVALELSADQRDDAQDAAFNYFAAAAYQGYAPAQLELGNMYLEGGIVEIDQNKAFMFYHKAAMQGLASAELNLGLMYQKGMGTEQNPQKAIQYYELAAEKGQAQAQYNLGVAYFVGYGVEKDMFKAKEWLTRALKNGNASAMMLLERINVV